MQLEERALGLQLPSVNFSLYRDLCPPEAGRWTLPAFGPVGRKGASLWLVRGSQGLCVSNDKPSCFLLLPLVLVRRWWCEDNKERDLWESD